MKKYISVLVALCSVFLLSVGAQARVLKSRIPESRGVAADGIVINGEKITFSEHILLDGRISIMLPDIMTDMPQEMKDILYPFEPQPQIAKYRYDNYNISFFLIYDEFPINPDEFKEFIERLHKSDQMVKPKDIYYNIRTEQLGTTVNWTDYKHYYQGGESYEFNARFLLDGKLTRIIFHCPFEFKDEWEPVAQTVLPTIKECEIK